MMALNWRNLPAVISTDEQIHEVDDTIDDHLETIDINDDAQQDVAATTTENEEIVCHQSQGTQSTSHALHANGIKVIYDATELDGEHTTLVSPSEDDHASDDSEDADMEEKKKRRRAKFEAKIREKYGDYFESDANELQTVPYRAPRRTLGCPHWRIGCKFEGDEAALSQHLQDCPFEQMKAMIRKRDHQINGLERSHQQLQHQVSQLHSILSSFVSLQSPELQNHLLSQLPNTRASQSGGIHHRLTRNISSELYDVSRTAINLSSLHALDGETRSVAYDRRRYNHEMIKRHRDSIKGALILQWHLHTKESFIDDHMHMHTHDGSHLLTPSVNFVSSTQNNRTRPHRLPPHTQLLSLPSNADMEMNHHHHQHTTATAGINETKENAIRALIMFWNRVVSASDHGVQVWNIDAYEPKRSNGDVGGGYTDISNITMFGGGHGHAARQRIIKQLSFDSMLCNEPSFSLATQPFAHPYWLFTGHRQTIRAWKYNGAQFNASCTCNACMLSFPSRGFGAVRCLAVSADHVFASSDSNVIQFWTFSETEMVDGLQRRSNSNASSSTHSLGAHALDKRMNAFGHVEYVGHLLCGHRGMITALKVFGDVLISGSKDGFITIWSITKFVNLSLLHYGPNAVLDFTIFPNPYPLCHMTIWNEHLNALSKMNQNQNGNASAKRLRKKHEVSHSSPGALTQTPPKLINHEDTTSRWPSLPNETTNASDSSGGSKTWMQHISLSSLYENDRNMSTGQRNKIQDTIMDFCGNMNGASVQQQQQQENGDVDVDDDDVQVNDDDAVNILSNDDAPDVLESVFRAAIPSTPGSSNNSEDQLELNKSLSPVPLSPHQSPASSQPQPQAMATKPQNMVAHNHSNHNDDDDDDDDEKVLCREIMNTASGHFGISLTSFILKDLKLIVGGHSGEIHIWHIGNRRSAFNMTPNWERESILRGHGDRVTRLEAFGNHLLSAYSNGSIKLWQWNDNDFLCTGTAYTDEVKTMSSSTAHVEIDNDGFHNKSCADYNSVRCLLLLPSPTLNLNSARDNKPDMIPRSPNMHAWSSAFEDSDNISDDDMELNLNDFNVKISPNVDDKIYNGRTNYTHAQRRKRKDNRKKNSSHAHINSYYNHPFWILSGTSDGSLLMHKLDDGSNASIHQY